MKNIKSVKKVKSKSSRMKSYESFDHWKRDQNKNSQNLIQALRKIVNDCSLPLTEIVKWGNGCWAKDDLAIIFLYGMTDGVQFGFFAGSMISDPRGRLQGKGKFVRAVHIHSKGDIDAKYFTSLIKKATKIDYKGRS